MFFQGKILVFRNVHFDEIVFPLLKLVESYDQSGSNSYYLTDYNLYLRTFLIERSYWTFFMLVHFKPHSHLYEIVKWYYC